MTPLGVALAAQRDLLAAGQETLETAVDFRRVATRSLLDGIESQREAQRRILGLQYVTLRRTIRRTDEETPGPAATEEILRDLDRQLADLQADQEAAIDTLVSTIEGTDDTVETLTLDSLDSLDTLEEQLVGVESLLEELDPPESGTPDDGTDR
jgi:hypothetical protein